VCFVPLPRPKLPKRRPSAPLVISLLALFVALGGPAQAARLVRSSDVKDRSLQVRDLSRKAVKELKKTPRRSVGERALANRGVTNAKLRDGSVTASKLGAAAVGATQLAPGAVGPRELKPFSVGPAQLADGAVSGAKVADGSLTVADLARFWGRFSVVVPPVAPHKCWSGEPRDLAPEQAGADLSGDLVVVTPAKEWPQDQLAFTRRNSANPSRFVLAGCNVTDDWALPVAGDSQGTEISFRYAVFDLP
jgi:hypothetical protein